MVLRLMDNLTMATMDMPSINKEVTAILIRTTVTTNQKLAGISVVVVFCSHEAVINAYCDPNASSFQGNKY